MATVKQLIEQAGGTAKESVETAKTRYLEVVDFLKPSADRYPLNSKPVGRRGQV